MRKNFGALAMLATVASLSQEKYSHEYEDKFKSKNSDTKKSESPIQKGMKYYCFRFDGTYLQLERDGSMSVHEKFFSCFALNDKNAIKKFNAFFEEYKNQ